MKTYLQIEVTDEFKKSLSERAKKEFTTMSALARSILRAYVESKPTNLYERSKLPHLIPEKDSFEQSLKEAL